MVLRELETRTKVGGRKEGVASPYRDHTFGCMADLLSKPKALDFESVGRNARGDRNG